MLQKLMADRYKLKFHHETRELAVFALTVGKDGPKHVAENTGEGTLPSLFSENAGRDYAAGRQCDDEGFHRTFAGGGFG